MPKLVCRFRHPSKGSDDCAGPGHKARRPVGLRGASPCDDEPGGLRLASPSGHPQTLRDLEHGTLHIRTPQTRIRRATGFHVLQRCPVASKAATPCWRKTSFSRRTPTTLRSGTVDHRARGCHVSGRRAMNAGQNPSPTGPLSLSATSLAAGEGRGSFEIRLLLHDDDREQAGLPSKARTGCKACLLVPDDVVSSNLAARCLAKIGGA
jgi:hypothetical protein